MRRKPRVMKLVKLTDEPEWKVLAAIEDNGSLLLVDAQRCETYGGEVVWQRTYTRLTPAQAAGLRSFLEVQP